MIPSTLPQRPWEKIGTDLFELKGKSYLLLVDYFSRYIEVVKLTQGRSHDSLSGQVEFVPSLSDLHFRIGAI